MAVGAVAVVGAVALVDNGDDTVAVQAPPSTVMTSQAAVSAATIVVVVTTSPPATTETPTTAEKPTTSTTTAPTTSIAQPTTTSEAIPIVAPFDPLGTWAVVDECQAVNCEGGRNQATITDYDPVAGTFVIAFPDGPPSTATIVGTKITFDLVGEPSTFVIHVELTASTDGQVWSGTWAANSVGIVGTLVFTRIAGP